MRICVADLEADGLLDEATKVHCGVFKDIRSGEVWKFTEPLEIQGFMDSCDALAMHNGVGYDWPLLRKLYGYEYKGSKIDTLLMSRLQKPNRFTPPGCNKGPHSIEAWGRRLGRYKPDHEDWSRFSPEMMHRCTEDVEIQHLTLNALLAEGRGHDWKRAHKLTSRLFEILELQESYGWLADQPYMHQCIATLTRWMDKVDTAVLPYLPYVCIRAKKTKGEYSYYKSPFTKSGRMQSYVAQYVHDTDGDFSPDTLAGPFSRVDFQRVDLGSNSQVKDFLLGAGWVPEVWNTNDDGERTSPKLSQDDPFEGVSGGVGRLIVKRVKCRHRRSQIQGWLDNLREDGRISQGIGGIAQTGRLKHRRLVNVPGSDAFFGNAMRKIFICKPGYKIVGVDSAGCQNRMLAARCGDPNFTKILIDGDKSKGTSIHQVNQAAIEEYAGFRPSYKISKNLNYAFMFGARDPRLATTAGVPQSKGPLIREGLLSISPGFEKLVNDLTAEWRSTAKQRKGKYGMEFYGGYIKGLDGRPIFIEYEHCILVYMLQSDEAIMMQYALLFLYDWCLEEGWVHGREFGFVCNMHDEIQSEVRDDVLERFSELAERSIAYAGEYLEINCPHQGEADIGINWKETH